MATLTLSDARSLMLKGKPWTFRMEHTSNGHNKFWLATGRKQGEPVEIHYGVIGSGGTILVKDWAYVERTAPEKEAKGYDYADTPFVRVQQATIDAAAAHQASVGHHVLIVTTGPAKATPVPAPAQIPPVPTGLHAQPFAVTAPISVPLPLIPTPAVQASGLPGPWGRIVAVQKQPDGTWAGLSNTGSKVLSMTKDGARNLVQGHSHIQVVGL
jgi:hypothetical protein